MLGKGDKLGRFYTPLDLTRVYVNSIELEEEPSIVLDPSVGSGNFITAAKERWPDAQTIGIDIDPSAEGLALCDCPIVADWLQISSTFSDYEVPLVLGNPPFGKAVKHAVTVAHVLAALRVGRSAHQLLPCDYVGASKFDDKVLSKHTPKRITFPIGRPWPLNLREVAIFEWLNGGSDRVGSEILRLSWKKKAGRV